MGMEAPSRNMLCQECSNADVQWRCLDCLGRLEVCTQCLLHLHRRLPNHRVEEWVSEKQGHFIKSSLINAGYVLDIGHSGQCCSSTNLDSDDFSKGKGNQHNENVKDQNLVVVDIGGIFQHKVLYCPENKKEHWEQLFEMGLFPASTTRPHTVFTFGVLDYFNLDVLECKTSAMSFMSKLSRLSNALFPHEVQVNAYQLAHCLEMVIVLSRTVIENSCE